ncbi:MAG: hypothetical protein MJA32_12065 [Proteobacteria bacterium]|nr:hypothetical protein [Pseudomonadota bacterium]
MSRSPLAYPLNRTADTDVGGAADLQTDVMRFMAILALCLVAVFALVQSIPMAPVATVGGPSGPTQPTAEREPAATVGGPSGPTQPAAERQPAATVGGPSGPTRPATEAAPTDILPAEPASAEPEQQGFTLRFASDAALTRAVAAHHVGLYALSSGRARRMTVSESRISFWDASMPNAFHEMEAGTVPEAVVGALARTGGDTGNVSWGVTLPGKMKSQLDSLLREHRGGSLIITALGEIRREGP